MKKYHHQILALTLVLILAGLFSGCGGWAGAPEETRAALPGTQEAIQTTEEHDMKQATLSFHSFDGGGPSFNAILEDSSLVEVQRVRDYGGTDPELVDGAAFDVIFTFTGLIPGQTGLRIEERSPIAGSYNHTYLLTVGEDLTVSIEALEVTDLDWNEEP